MNLIGNAKSRHRTRQSHHTSRPRMHPTNYCIQLIAYGRSSINASSFLSNQFCVNEKGTTCVILLRSCDLRSRIDLKVRILPTCKDWNVVVDLVLNRIGGLFKVLNSQLTKLFLVYRLNGQVTVV